MWKRFSNYISQIFRHSPIMTVCWGVVSIFALYLTTFSVEEFLIRFGIGDALVYARVAFNIASGKGSTYNLLVPTNGYHPLWLCLHIPLMFGAETIMSRMWLLEKFWIFIALCGTFAWSALIRTLTKSDLAAGLTAVLFGSFGWSLYVLYSGIETPLVFLCLALLFFVVHRVRQARSAFLGRELQLYAAIAALTFLARLDSILLIIPTLWLVFPGFLRVTPLERLRTMGIFCGITLPYFAWNLSVIGKLMPVSGLVKTMSTINIERSHAMIAWWISHINKLGLSASILYFIALGTAFGVIGVYWLLRDNHPAMARLLAVVSVGSFVHYAYYLILMREINVPWHMYSQFLTAYLFVIALFVVLEQKCFRYIKGARLYRQVCLGILGGMIIGTLFVTLKYHRIKQVRRPENAVAFDVGRWVLENLPENARIAMFDSFVPAIVSPHQSFIDLNGLVGDLHGAQLIRQRKQKELITLRGGEFLIHKDIESVQTSLPVNRESLLSLAVFTGETAIYNFHYTIYALCDRLNAFESCSGVRQEMLKKQNEKKITIRL